MGREGGDCGTAGQLLDTAFSPAAHYFQRCTGMAPTSQSCVCVSVGVCMIFRRICDETATVSET